MIQIQSITLREFRGIREVTLHPDGKNFVVSEPKGSGKSGVVDAIQFGLTGDISRLSAKGTAGLSVQRHGLHVDKRDDPEAAEVSLTLLVPETGKTVVLTRNVKIAKTFTLVPEHAKVRAVEEVALHPELTLSRREIIKYILVEADERCKYGCCYGVAASSWRNPYRQRECKSFWKSSMTRRFRKCLKRNGRGEWI